jgi:DNA-binding MarR family transcriptional regulator
MRVSKAIQTEIAAMRAAGDAPQVFNVAGGTRIMSACALLVCTLEGVNCVYVHDDTLEEIPLPMLQIRYSDVLTPVQRAILRYLLEHREEDVTQKELGLAFALHKATVNHHIKELVARGAVYLMPSPKDSRIKLIRVEESMELLLGRP